MDTSTGIDGCLYRYVSLPGVSVAGMSVTGMGVLVLVFVGMLMLVLMVMVVVVVVVVVFLVLLVIWCMAASSILLTRVWHRIHKGHTYYGQDQQQGHHLDIHVGSVWELSIT